MKLSIVIVNYNVKHFLEQCLRSVFDAIEGIESEVYVVDNHSVDGSVEMVRSTFPEVKLIANNDNVGFSKANNQAIRLCQGEYVLLLNPDTVVPENCFTQLLHFCDQAPDFGACGVHMVDGQGKFLPESKRGLPTPEVALYKMLGLNKLFPRSKKFGKYHLGYLPEDRNNEVEVLSGAFMLIKRSVLDKVGLLDEDFFMYGEDIDLSYRITKGGFKNYYYADTSIIHYKGESTKKLTVNYVRIFYKAMILFANKHYSGGVQRIFTSFINAAIYARAALALVVNFIRKAWLALFETGLIFLILYLLKEYWEEHIKNITSYPREMMTIHLPYYTIIWVVSLWFNGSYRFPFSFQRLFRGIAIGTVIIASIYGLLPNDLHFSRGIILFGTLAVTTGLILWRTLLHFIRFRSLDINQSKYRRSVVVGDVDRWKFVVDIFTSHRKDYQPLGYVSDHGDQTEHHLGTIDQLEEIVKIYQVNEVIFSADVVGAEDTMRYMKRLGPHIDYFIIPSNSDFLIGSHSKNDSGLYLGEHFEFNLASKEYRRQKRSFDLFFAAVLITQFFWLLLFPYGRHLMKHLGKVISGQMSWVGYSGDEKELLPDLRPGVISTDRGVGQSNERYQFQLNRLYAKDYTVTDDVRLLLGLR